VGIVIPPTGPRPADFRLDSMCGDDVECLSARLCSIGGRPGESGISRVVFVMRSLELVLRLSWLGFRFMAGIVGRMNDGDEGSDTRDDAAGLATGG
jgi:hypothetical protein